MSPSVCRVSVVVRQQFADRTGLSSAIAQIVVDGALFDAERMSGFGDGEFCFLKARARAGAALVVPGLRPV